jgi:phage baseplate assembly protein W
MAVRDLAKKPYIEDRDDEIFIGIDLPFRKSNGVDGWFASSTTTIQAVKNNIRYLLTTKQGERFLQPNLGINFDKYMFEQYTDELRVGIENDIVDTFNFWLPFVNITDIKIGMSDGESGVDKNRLNIYLEFNINRDPNTLESVQVEIT